MEDNAITIAPATEIQKPASEEIVVAQRTGAVVQVRSRMLTIKGKRFTVDPYQLIRIIKRVTQSIGEYRDAENPYAAYVVDGLRKARGDMVSDLENNFHIHWQIDQHTGNSVFFM